MSPGRYIVIKYAVELQACPHSILSPQGSRRHSSSLGLWQDLWYQDQQSCCWKTVVQNDCPQVMPCEQLLGYQFVTRAIGKSWSLPHLSSPLPFLSLLFSWWQIHRCSGIWESLSFSFSLSSLVQLTWHRWGLAVHRHSFRSQKRDGMLRVS